MMHHSGSTCQLHHLPFIQKGLSTIQCALAYNIMTSLIHLTDNKQAVMGPNESEVLLAGWGQQ